MPVIHRHTHGHAEMYGLARHAAWYDRQAGLLARPLYRGVAADVAKAGLPAGAVVLDVGTGPGRVPRLIAEACPQVTVLGIDLSAEMIARASSVAAASAQTERITFQVANVAELPFEDASIDLVISSISLHHWDDPAAGLREVVRVLRPGAHAWIYDFRPALRDPDRLTAGLDADVLLEAPAQGRRWFSPISRLVLRRH
jgi:ubiquinone/menaquinone biosynthesis C-methylase UbiE